LPPIPPAFLPLINALREQRQKGVERPLYSFIGGVLDRQTYQAAGKNISTYKTYMKRAKELGLVKPGQGKTAGREWVELERAYVT
jgi:hypothetical protein